MRVLTSAAVLLSALLIAVSPCRADNLWGGSLGLTSDYIVRGISRSNDQAALQLDLHYLHTSGFVAGLFASNSQIDPGEPRDVEFNAFVGFAWTASPDWRGKVLVSHYAYPWNNVGSRYDYDELAFDTGYREWLDVTLIYSPNTPRYFKYRGLRGVTAKSAEINVQRPVLGKLSATAGFGYYAIDGPEPRGYGYWSVGAGYDLAPVALAVSYVKATTAANALFYNAAVDGRWTGTVIWRF